MQLLNKVYTVFFANNSILGKGLPTSHQCSRALKLPMLEPAKMSKLNVGYPETCH